MKKIVKVWHVLTLFGLLFVFFPRTVSAANDMQLPAGVLISDDQGISLTKSEGYFFNLKQLFPGDRITREIDIKNKRDATIGVSMKIIPIKVSGPINLIKNIDMVIKYNDKVIFDGNLASQDKSIFKTGSEIQLGRIAANSDNRLHVELYVSPNIPIEDLINVESEAIVRWEVAALAIEDPKVDPFPEPSETEPSDTEPSDTEPSESVPIEVVDPPKIQPNPSVPDVPIVKPLDKPTIRPGYLPQLGEKADMLIILAIIAIAWTLYVYVFVYKKEIDT